MKIGCQQMSGYKTNKLSDPECRSAKPREKIYKLRDGGGLSLHVRVTGYKVWRYNYRFNGKQKAFTIGKYPDVGLAEARAKRDAAKKLISSLFSVTVVSLFAWIPACAGMTGG